MMMTPPADQEPGAQRRSRWHSVAFRLNGSLALLLVLSLMATGVTFSVFRLLDESYSEITSQSLPIVIAANRLGQESESIAAQAPLLALAGSFAQVDSLTARIEDHLSWLEQLIGDLDAANVDQGLIKIMLTRRDEMSSALNALRLAAKSRLILDGRMQETLDGILEIHNQAVVLRAPVEWVAAMDAVATTSMAMMAANGGGRLDRLRTELATAVRRANEVNAPERSLSPEARALWIKLRQLVGSESGVVQGRSWQFDQSLRVKGALEGGRVAAARLASATSDVIAAVEKQIALNHAMVKDRLASSRQWVAGMAVLMVITVGLVLAYVQGSISRRLSRIHGAVMARREDHGAVIPPDGNDEIGDIGRAINGYASLIETREAALRTFKDQLVSILEAAPFPMAVLDVSYLPLYLNPSAQALLPHLIGDTFFDALLARSIDGHAAEMELVRPDGGTFWAQVTWAPIRFGAEQAILLTVYDIDALKSAEKRSVELIGELKRSNADLEAFAYVTSHDLREPLRTVKGFLDLLVRRYGTVLTGEGKEFIDFATDGVQRMDRLIVDLLEFSRIGRQGRDDDVVDTEDVLEEVKRDLTALIEEASAVIDVDGTLPYVLGNRPDVMRVFQNLLSNALHYRWPDEPAHIQISVVDQGGRWRFSIADNGVGIAPEFHSRIFDVFQRIDTSGVHDKGTGIGLAVVRRVVERFGGEITVASRPGRGTVFVFTLPGVSDSSATAAGPDLS